MPGKLRCSLQPSCGFHLLQNSPVQLFRNVEARRRQLDAFFLVKARTRPGKVMEKESILAKAKAVQQRARAQTAAPPTAPNAAFRT